MCKTIRTYTQHSLKQSLAIQLYDELIIGSRDDGIELDCPI